MWSRVYSWNLLFNIFWKMYSMSITLRIYSQVVYIITYNDWLLLWNYNKICKLYASRCNTYNNKNCGKNGKNWIFEHFYLCKWHSMAYYCSIAVFSFLLRSLFLYISHVYMITIMLHIRFMCKSIMMFEYFAQYSLNWNIKSDCKAKFSSLWQIEKKNFFLLYFYVFVYVHTFFRIK